MVDVEYSHRLVCDGEFLLWLSTHPKKTMIASCLMNIKASSKHHRKDHNIILESESKVCIERGIDKNKIGKMFKIVEDPDFLSILNDQLTKNIIFSIDTASHKPFRTYIFTTEDKFEEYHKNPHYQSVKSVMVKAGEDAIKIIEEFFKEFASTREFERSYIQRV